MLLRELSLKNIGLYRGEQSLVFSTESERPITLIGGQNGAGKTTIIDALFIVMYGSRARTLIGFRNYSEFLRAFTHGDQTDASVSLEFDRLEGSITERYLLQRSWVIDGIKNLKETLSVSINGEDRPDCAQNWSEHIEQILPKSMAGLFVFDGEKIEALADIETSTKALKASLYGLLGLDLIGSLKSDLFEFRRKAALAIAESKDTELDRKLGAAETTLRIAKDRVVKVELSVTVASSEVDDCLKELEEVNTAFAQAGGELFEKREELIAAEGVAENRLSIATKKARELAASAAPLLQISPLLEQVAEVSSNITQLAEAELLLHSHKERDERLITTLGVRTGLDNNQLEALTQILDEDRQRYEHSYQAPFDISVEMGSAAEWLSVGGGKLIREELIQTIKELKSSASDIDACRRTLQSVPAGTEMTSVLTKVAIAEERLVATKKTLSSQIEDLNQAEFQEAKESREFEKLAVEILESQSGDVNAMRISREVGKAQIVLDQFQSRVVTKNVGRIKANILEALTSLYRKKTLIKDINIDVETLAITLIGASGELLDPERLSAGERQLLATGLIWGLSKSTSRELPTVIDTPVGRLDRQHRKHLVQRYFPKASRQVILLSTDEEIVGAYYTELKSYVGKSYLLDFVEEDIRTSIKEGYFDE